MEKPISRKAGTFGKRLFLRLITSWSLESYQLKALLMTITASTTEINSIGHPNQRHRPPVNSIGHPNQQHRPTESTASATRINNMGYPIQRHRHRMQAVLG